MWASYLWLNHRRGGRRSFARAARLAAGLLVASPAAPPGAHAAAIPKLPQGFSDSLVANVFLPTALAFLPDGHLLVASQPGHLYAIDPDTPGGRPRLILDVSRSTCARLELGLLGVAVDPAFARNGHLYVFYTHDEPGCVQRISRFTVGAGGVAGPGSERVLLDRIPAPNGNHSGGDLQFGRDGLLYVSVGDGGCDYEGAGCQADNDAARDRHVLAGKVLRVTPEGGIPADNPFTGPGTARCEQGGTGPGLVCQETFAWGLRNPFRLAFDPDAPGTRFFINDVGQDHWEEIDEGAAGADYGWNRREGFCATDTVDDCDGPPPGMTDPVHAYSHDRGCVAITGGAFVPDGLWPASYDDAYLFADFGCGVIFELRVDGRGRARTGRFASGLGPWNVTHLSFGPAGASGALYYASLAGGGEVHRIAYAGGAG